MFAKVLISCALLVAAAQAGYTPSHYNKALIGGYAAQYEPALTVSVLPSYGHNYGAAPSYGNHGYGYGYQAPHTAYYSSQPMSYKAGVDGDALRLAGMALSLPSAGAPNPVTMHIPNYSSTGYTAPVVNNHYNSPVNGASAAAAAANVDADSDSYKSY